jgi:hypothetical protein
LKQARLQSTSETFEKIAPAPAQVRVIDGGIPKASSGSLDQIK